MSYIVVDVETDGQTPWDSSMVCFGAVLVKDMTQTFYGQTAPISDSYNPESLAISGFTREQHKQFPDPKVTMEEFYKWVTEVSSGRPILITDNPAFDFAWINYYFHRYCGKNPFGYSARRIGDLYCGMKGDAFANWKYLRKTKHTHHPVDDAKGNAEVLHFMKDTMGLKIKF